MNILKFVGTGAAEAIPDPFCDCRVCSAARAQKGIQLRTRSVFRITDDVQIDFGPDSNYQSVKCGNDLRNLRNILITHSHEDHCSFSEFGLREMAWERRPFPLNVYLSRNAYEWIKSFPMNMPALNVVNFVSIEYGVEYDVGDVRVKPLKGNHPGNGKNELSMNYLVTLSDGRKLYYAVDSGYYFEETFSALSGEKLDFLIMECTFGSRMDRGEEPNGHLDCRSYCKVVRRLYEQGAIHSNTMVYATHINHKHDFDHFAMQRFFDQAELPVRVTVAYDGLCI